MQYKVGICDRISYHPVTSDRKILHTLGSKEVSRKRKNVFGSGKPHHPDCFWNLDSWCYWLFQKTETTVLSLVEQELYCNTAHWNILFWPNSGWWFHRCRDSISMTRSVKQDAIHRALCFCSSTWLWTFLSTIGLIAIGNVWIFCISQSALAKLAFRERLISISAVWRDWSDSHPLVTSSVAGVIFLWIMFFYLSN